MIRLPAAHERYVTLIFRLSPDTPYEANVVTVAGIRTRVTKQPEPITIRISSADIAIHSDQAFAPATVLHNQDPRILAVQLLRVVQSP